MRRERDYERMFLAEAERLVRLAGGGYTERVVSRLEVGEHLYGDRWAEMELVRIVREVAEEAEDIGAWGVLAAQRLGHDHPAVPHLLRAIAGAVGSWEELRAARELIKDPEATPARPISEYEG